MDCLDELLGRSYEIFQVLLGWLPDRDLVVASIGAFFGAWFATHFSGREKNKRIDSIKRGIYSDIQTICSKHEGSLEHLLHFIKSPVFRNGDRLTICSLRPNDVSPMSHELIALGSPLSDDQRRFINTLPILVDNVEGCYQVIFNRIDSEASKGVVVIPRQETAMLIYEIVSLIHCAHLFCMDREAYTHPVVRDSAAALELILGRMGVVDQDLIKAYSEALPSFLNS